MVYTLGMSVKRGVSSLKSPVAWNADITKYLRECDQVPDILNRKLQYHEPVTLYTQYTHFPVLGMKRHYLSVFKWTWINNDAEKKFITDIKSVNCSECKPLWQFKKSNGTSIFSDYTPHSLFGPCDIWVAS